MDDQQLYQRYHRQLILPGFGMSAQKKLKQARVLVVGAGGLGCPALMTLAAAGIGTIGIADDGLVELSNLHRQLLYNTSDIDRLKVICASERLQAMNPDVTIHRYEYRLDTANALDIFADYEVILDGTDNFHTRYLINDACALLGKPLIYGAISRYEGQVAVFEAPINYRDLFPYPPAEADVPNCSEAGVLGVLPSIIGSLMANECIKLLTGIGEVLTGKLLTFDALTSQSYVVNVSATALGRQLLPISREAFESTDYPALCGIDTVSTVDELDPGSFYDRYLQGGLNVVDVREPHEKPKLSGIDHLRIPLSVFTEQASRIQQEAVVFICQSGKRSLKAAELYHNLIEGRGKKIYSLVGGINSLMLEDM
ncbi:adenylyltransferase and sulfurtransferase [bacterium A37T11]|nr:adenylyltransferase and sulfurtransferase [bacterium A37T11]